MQLLSCLLDPSCKKIYEVCEQICKGNPNLSLASESLLPDWSLPTLCCCLCTFACCTRMLTITARQPRLRALSPLKEKGLSSHLHGCNPLTWVSSSYGFLLLQEQDNWMRKKITLFQARQQPTGSTLQAVGALPPTLLSLERTCLIVWGKTRQTALLSMESSAPHLPPKDATGSAGDTLVIYIKIW